MDSSRIKAQHAVQVVQLQIKYKDIDRVKKFERVIYLVGLINFQYRRIE